jgi:hypothetical protein
MTLNGVLYCFRIIPSSVGIGGFPIYALGWRLGKDLGKSDFGFEC